MVKQYFYISLFIDAGIERGVFKNLSGCCKICCKICNTKEVLLSKGKHLRRLLLWILACQKTLQNKTWISGLCSEKAHNGGRISERANARCLNISPLYTAEVSGHFTGSEFSPALFTVRDLKAP
jgi:hypothetical protein